jgi:CRP-like cAMP-binding protein
VVKGSIVSSAARQARIGRFEGSGSFSGLARVAGLTLKQPTVYFLAPLVSVSFPTGDKGDGCYRLDVGLLKVSLISPQVKERIIAIITPGVVVGDLDA